MRRFVVAALVVLVCAGCGQKLNVEKTVSLGAGEARATIVDAPARDQNLTVTVNSPGQVDVYVVPDKDIDAVVDALANTSKKPANPLASKEKVTEGTLEVKVPAKTGFAVVLNNAGGKATEVKLKITGK